MNEVIEKCFLYICFGHSLFSFFG